MKKRYVLSVAASAVATIIGFLLIRNSEPMTVSAAPIPVQASPVVVKDVPVYLSGLGTVASLQTVTIRTRVDGRIESVRFKEGQHIHAGDKLIEIDSRYLRAKLKQATGQLKRDQAALANAKRDLDRYRHALATGTVTQQTFDGQVAVVEQNKGSALADQGLIEEVKTELDYCTIRSPIDGTVGLRQVDAGNIVRTTDVNGIVTIVAQTPINVVFSVPQSDIGRVRKAQRNQVIPVAALDADDREVLSAGSVDAIDNVVDPSTGTIKLKAIFDNSKGSLYPGQFVNARMHVSTLKQVPVVPSHAVLHGAKGDYVYVVLSDRTVKLVLVKSGPESHGQTALIGGGIKEGDIVVTDGSARVSDHAAVIPLLTAATTRRDSTRVPRSAAQTPAASHTSGASMPLDASAALADEGDSGSNGAAQ